MNSLQTDNNPVPHYGAEARRDDERNNKILSERMAALNAVEGARVGDFLILPNGKITRFTHDWTDSIQTGGYGGSFYLGNGYTSYSGGLNPGIKHAHLELTNEVREGSIWFFSCDYHRAHSAVYYSVPFRVYRVKEGVPQSELSGLWMDNTSDYSGNSKQAVN